MIPQVGQHVKCIFRNGTLIEGQVEKWEKNIVQLKSFSDQSIIVILHPDEDLMLFKIFIPKLSSNETPPKQNIKNKLKETLSAPEDIKKQPLKELRNLVLEEEKQIITNKIKEHFSDSINPSVNYASQITILKGSK